MDIYDRIDDLLRERKMSRRKLAELAGINVNTMSSLFARRPENFPRQHLNSIARVLNVTPTEIEGFGKLSLFTEASTLSPSAPHIIYEISKRGFPAKPEQTETSPLSETLARLENMDRQTLEFIAQYINTLLAGLE